MVRAAWLSAAGRPVRQSRGCSEPEPGDPPRPCRQGGPARSPGLGTRRTYGSPGRGRARRSRSGGTGIGHRRHPRILRPVRGTRPPVLILPAAQRVSNGRRCPPGLLTVRNGEGVSRPSSVISDPYSSVGVPVSDLHPETVPPLGEGWRAFAAAAECELPARAGQWPAAAVPPAGPGPRVHGAVQRRRVGLVVLALGLTLPVLGLAAACVGEPGSVAPAAQAHSLTMPLLGSPAPASAEPGAAVVAGRPAATAVVPKSSPAGARPAPVSPPGRSGGRRTSGRQHRLTVVHRRPAGSGSHAPAEPWSPMASLPGGGVGALCQAAEQAGGLHGQQLSLCSSVYGG